MNYLIKKCFKLCVLLLILAALPPACDNTNEGGTGVSNPPTPSMSVVSSMTTIFNDVEFSATLWHEMHFLFVSAHADTLTEETCNTGAPASLNFEYVGETSDMADGTQTYGAAQNSVTVTPADFCIDSSQPTENNTGTGPDGNGLFASYAFRVDGTSNAECTNEAGTVSLQLGGRGVYRKTSSQIEIYGLFHTLFSDGEYDYNCTLILESDTGAVFSKHCSEIDTGAAVELTDGTTCVVTTTETAE